MTTAQFVQTLANEVREATSRLKLPVEYMRDATADDFVKVNVFEQYLPADLFEQTAYYPCVVVEWLKTVDNLKDGSIFTAGLTLGTFSKEDNGFMDAFHLMEVIRQRLLSKRVIGKRFRLVDEVTWETPNEQPTPFFFVMAELNYSTQLTLENIPFI